MTVEVVRVKIQEYASLRNKYVLPEQVESAGNVKDNKTGHVLAIGFRSKRYVYSEIGYICDEAAPDVFHACVCALMELVFEMPLIKTVLLTPDMVYSKICGEEPVTEEVTHYSNMALCALNEAFKGYLSSQTLINEKR